MAASRATVAPRRPPRQGRLRRYFAALPRDRQRRGGDRAALAHFVGPMHDFEASVAMLDHGRARARGRMAPQRAIPARLPAARHSVAAALDGRLARSRLRLARQPDAGGRAARRDLATYGHRTGVAVYNRPASSVTLPLGSPMDLGIAGRKAIVCASSRGLGRGCALALAQAGCEVVINGRDGKTLDATATALRQATGGKVTAVQADVATAEGQAALLGACPEPDILVNNNAGPPFRDFRELTRPQMIDGVIANMVVAIELTQKVIDPMVRRQFGRIVNITSGSVKMPLAGLDLSSGARAGLTAFFAGSRARLPPPTSRSISCCPAPSTPSGCTRTSWPMPKARAFRSRRQRRRAWRRCRPSAAPSCAPPRPATSPGRTCSSTAARSPARCDPQKRTRPACAGPVAPRL